MSPPSTMHSSNLPNFDSTKFDKKLQTPKVKKHVLLGQEIFHPRSVQAPRGWQGYSGNWFTRVSWETQTAGYQRGLKELNRNQARTGLWKQRHFFFHSPFGVCWSLVWSGLICGGASGQPGAQLGFLLDAKSLRPRRPAFKRIANCASEHKVHILHIKLQLLLKFSH